MELIRGWENQYLPDNTGGLRLKKAREYRTIKEDEGLGDKREGELRVNMPGTVTSTTKGPFSFPTDFVITPKDGPETVVKGLMPGERRDIQTSIRVEDSQLDSPFLFCLAKKPLTKSDWEKLRAALPDRYDTWTLTDNLNALKFEIECGIKRWLALNDVTEHRICWTQGWVNYSYDRFPAGANPSDLAEAIQLPRWLRKARKYKGQQEYRLAWQIQSTQMEKFPSVIDIELTRTGLGLFKPWSPPT